MQGPFDIAADLDTPVSTFLKLAAAQAALPAGERGERLPARALLVPRLRRRRRVAPGRTAACAATARRGPARRPRGAARRVSRRAGPRRRAWPRRFPSCRSRAGWSASRATTWCATSSACSGRPPAPASPAVPEAAYLATDSLLVFDHLTRRIALLHAGSDAERARTLRREIMRLLRGPLPPPAVNARHGPAAQSLSGEEFRAAVGPGQALHLARRRLPAGAVGALLRRALADAVRDLPRAAPAESLALHVLPRSRRRAGGRLLAGGAGEAARGPRLAAADRRHAPARRRSRRGPGARGEPQGRREGERRARHAGGPRAQRPRPRRGRGLRARGSLQGHRALQPRHAHRQRRAGRSSRRAATPSICSPPPFPPGRWSARRRCGRWS